MGRSEYVLREKTRYDKELVRLAEKWVRDGLKIFGHHESELLWQFALHGSKLTERERATLRYLLNKYDFEPGVQRVYQMEESV